MLRIDQISRWDRPRCVDEWRRLTGAAPRSGLPIGFPRRALAFELQCKELNGHSAAVKRQLRGLVADAGPKAKPTPPKPALTCGTQLVREWNGRIYRVLVTDAGFELDGTTFTSLSSIAKHITGAEWSGPRFFGLRKR